MDLARPRLASGALALGSALLVGAPMAFAQSGPPPAATTDLGRIEITGSRVLSLEDETALPIQIIRREDIERSGATSADELLQQITANATTLAAGRYVGSQSNPGLSTLSFRGLLGRSTLILLDGRRLAPYALSSANGSSVDLNSIPLDAIERVEVLKDGASAIYGSDAVGGVVNFILRKNFSGAVATILHGSAEHGGASQTQSTATLGFGDLRADRYNVFVNLDYQRRSALSPTSRPYAASGDRPDLGIQEFDNDAFPANVGTPRGYVSPFAPNCPAGTKLFGRGCFLDITPYTDLIPAIEQTHAIARGQFRIDNDHTLFAEVLVGRNRTRTSIVSSDVGSDSIPSGDPISFPRSSPFFPANLARIDDLYYNTVPLGPRTTVTTADQGRFLLGARGQFAGWSYDTAIMFDESRVTNAFVNGFVSSTAIVAALESGAINPFGDSGPAGNALLASTERNGVAQRATFISRGFDGHASRDLFDLPAGPLALAVGIEGRKDALNDVFAPFLADIAGGTFSQGRAGTRSTEAAYAELGIPLLKSLDMQVAGRYDHYSDFGGTFNPKVSLRWQPTSITVFRASYGRGFRAPALSELYTAQSTDVQFIRDPVRCPVTGDDADCFARVNVRSGGSPALKAERSEQASAGFVLQPTRDATASIDFWRLHLSGEILPAVASLLLANEPTFDGTLVFRGPADPATPGLPGPLSLIDLREINTGGVHTHGFDVGLRWQSDATPFGRFGAALEGTYVQAFERQLAPSLTVNQRAVYAVSRVVPRWRHFLSGNWDYGAWRTSVTQSFESGYTDALADPDGHQPHVGATKYWGAQLAYSGVKHLTATVGVNNLFNSLPQVSNQEDFYAVGYNPSISDPRGRFWYGKLAVKF